MITDIYNFLMNLLFGAEVPAAIAGLSTEITIILSIFLAGLMLFVVWWTVKTVFFFILNAWR